MNQHVFNPFVYVGLLLLICSIGIVSNLLLIITLPKHNVFGHAFYSFLAAIAVLDLASIAFTVPTIISRCYGCNFGDTYITEIFTAFILVGIEKVFIVSSCWTVLALAFDCCLHTCKQDNTLATRLRASSPWLLIFTISMVSIIENLPTFWYYKLDKDGRIGAREDHETEFYIYSWVDIILTGVIYLLLLATLCGYLIWWYINDTGYRVSYLRRNRICPVPTTPQQNYKLPAKQRCCVKQQLQPKQRCCVNQHQQQQLESVLIEGQQTNGESQPGCSSSSCYNHTNPNKLILHVDTNSQNKQQMTHHHTTPNNSTSQNANPGNDKDDHTHTTSTITSLAPNPNHTTRILPALNHNNTTSTSPTPNHNKTTSTSPAPNPNNTTSTSLAPNPNTSTPLAPNPNHTTSTSPAPNHNNTTSTSPAPNHNNTTSTSPDPIRNSSYYSRDQLHTAVKTVIVLSTMELMTLGPGVGLQSIAMQQGPTPSELSVYQTITTVLVALIKSLKLFIYFGLDTQFRQACKAMLATTCRCFLKVKPQDKTTQAMTTSSSILGSLSSVGTPGFRSIYHAELDQLERLSSLTGLPSPRDTIQFFREHATQESQIQQPTQLTPQN